MPPPESDAPPPNAIVGDAAAGAGLLRGEVQPAATRRPAICRGSARGSPERKALQNFWVVGRRRRRRGGRGAGGRGAPARRIAATPSTATVTLPTGEKSKGRLVRIDNFLVTLALADGTPRTFRRDGAVPKVEVKDPLEPHKALLDV